MALMRYQPQGQARFSPAYAGRILAGWVTTPNGYKTLSSVTTITDGGFNQNHTVQAGPKGYALSYDGGATTPGSISFQLYRPRNNFTFAGLFYVRASGGAGVGARAGTDTILLWRAGGANYQVRVNGANITGPAMPMNTWLSYVLTSTTEGIFLYVNGQLVLSGAASTSSDNTVGYKGIEIFSDIQSSGGNMDMSVPLCVMMAGVTRAEAISLSQNLWQVFQSPEDSDDLFAVVMPSRGRVGRTSGSAIRYQPQWATSLDKSNPISRGVVFAETPLSIPNATPLNTPYGIAGCYPTVVPGWSLKASSNTPEITLFGVVMRNGVNNSSIGQYPTRLRNPGNSNTYCMNIGTSSYQNNKMIQAYISFSDYTDLSISATLPTSATGQLLVICATFSTITGVFNLWVDGNLLATAAAPNKALFVTEGIPHMADSAGGVNNTGLPTLLSGVWLRELQPTEIQSLTRNPWQLFTVPERDDNDEILAAAGVPGLYVLPADVGAFGANYVQAGVKKASKVAAVANSFNLNGLTTRVLNNKRVYAQTYNSTFVSADTKLLSARRVSADASSPFVFSSGITRVLNNKLVSAQSSSPMALNYGSVKLINNRLIYAQASPVSFSGVDNKLLNNKLVKAQAGSSTLSGVSSNLLNNKLVKAQAGSSTLTGISSNLLSQRLVKTQAGSSTLSGISSRLLANRKVSLSVGSVPLIANPASLFLTALGLLSVSSGAFSVVSSNTALRVGRHIVPSSISYTLTNVDNKLLVGRKLPSATSMYNVGTVGSKLIAARRARLDTQSYSLLGQNAFTRMLRRFSAAVDNYALGGTDSRLKLFLRLGAVGSSISSVYGNVVSRVSRKLPTSVGKLNYVGITTSFLYTRVSTGFKKRFRNMFRKLGL